MVYTMSPTWNFGAEQRLRAGWGPVDVFDVFDGIIELGRDRDGHKRLRSDFSHFREWGRGCK